MFRIRRFGIVKTANLAAVMYVFIILIVVIPIGLIAIAAGAGGRDIGGAAAGGGILLFGAVAAVFYGIFGWLFTALFCLIYNFVAGWTGGIEVQVERVEPIAPQLPASWGPGAPPAQQQQPPAGWGPGAPPTQQPPGSAGPG